MDFIDKMRQNLLKHQSIYSETIDKFSQIEDESEVIDWSEDEYEEYEYSDDSDSNEIGLEFNDNDKKTKNLVSQVCSTAKEKLLTSTPIPVLNPPLHCVQATKLNNDDMQLKITPIRADDLQTKNIIKKTNTIKNILTTVLERNLFKNKEKNQAIANDDDCVIIIDDVDVQSQIVSVNKQVQKDRKTICIDETKLIVNNDFSFNISQSKPNAQSTPIRFNDINKQLPTKTIKNFINEDSNKNCSRLTLNEQQSTSLKIVPNTQHSPSSTTKIVPNTQPLNESNNQKKSVFKDRFINSKNNYTINMSNLVMIPDSQPSEINESKIVQKQNTSSIKTLPNSQVCQKSTTKTKANIQPINESTKISNNQKHSEFVNRFTGFSNKKLPIEMLIDEDFEKNHSRLIPNTQQSPSSITKIVPNTQPLNESNNQKKPVFLNKFINSKNDYTINMSNLVMIPDSQPSEINESKTVQKPNETENRRANAILNEIFGNSTNEKSTINLSISKTIPDSQPSMTFVSQMVNKTIQQNTTVSIIPDTQVTIINKTAFDLNSTPNKINETKFDSTMTELLSRSNQNKFKLKVVENTLPSVSNLPRPNGKELKRTNLDRSRQNDSDLQIHKKCKYQNESEDDIIVIEDSPIKQSTESTTKNKSYSSEMNKNKNSKLGLINKALISSNASLNSSSNDLKQKAQVNVQKALKSSSKLVTFNKTIKQPNEVLNDGSLNQGPIGLNTPNQLPIENDLFATENEISKKLKPKVSIDLFDSKNIDPEQIKKTKILPKSLNQDTIKMNLNEKINDSQKERVSNSTTDKTINRLSVNNLFDINNADESKLLRAKNPLEYKKKDQSSRSINKSIKEIKDINSKTAQDDSSEYEPQIKKTKTKNLTEFKQKDPDPEQFQSNDNLNLSTNLNDSKHKAPGAQLSSQISNKSTPIKRINDSKIENKKSNNLNNLPIQNDFCISEVVELEVIKPQSTCKKKNLSSDLFDSEEIESEQENLQIKNSNSQVINNQISNDKRTHKKIINDSKIEKSKSGNSTIDLTQNQDDFYISEVVELKPQSTCKKKNDTSDLFDSEEIESEQENLQIKNSNTHDTNIVNNETSKQNEIITETVNKENKSYNMKPIRIHTSLKRTSSSVSVGNKTGFIFCGTFIKAPVPNDSIHDINNTKNKIVIRPAINKTVDTKSNQSVNSSARRSDKFDLRKFLSDTFNKTKT